MRQVRMLRTEFGSQIDDREAYVDAVVLNVYGGQGVTNVWIDDLEVAGHATTLALASYTQEIQGPALGMPSGNASAPNPSPTVSPTPNSSDRMVPVRLPSSQTAPSASEIAPMVPVQQPIGSNMSKTLVPFTSPLNASPHRAVKLNNSVLLVNNRPMFPRAIEHRGEPLSFLKRLGFNTVWLQRLPAPELLEEADRLGLWLVCPPPRDLTSTAEISQAFDSVLAWDLGSDLTSAELEASTQWKKQIRAADRRGNRPLICRPRNDLRSYSRVADFLLIDRRPLGTSLQMDDYASWVRHQPLLARPGTLFWTTVQTQPNEALRQQLTTLEPGAATPSSVAPEQIRLLAYTAVASGSRGMLFLSDSPLDAPDAATQQRAMTLELLNLEMDLIEPWAAAGDFVASADCNTKEVVGSVLHAERAWLLLPIWFAPMTQYVPSQSAANAVTLVVPGIPEANNAYELTPNGVQPLRHKRVAGGLSVTLDEFGLTSQILLAQDPSIISAVHRRATEVGRRAAELQYYLAMRKMQSVQTITAALAGRPAVPQAASWMDIAKKDLQLCDRNLAAGNTPLAAQCAQRAMRSLRMIERAHWDAAVKGICSPAMSPAVASFETLPFHWRLVDWVQANRFGPSRIAGGDFENIETMQRAGWRFIQQPCPSVHAAVDLLPAAAHSGLSGLRLAVAPIDPKKPPAAVESPPILFTSPSISVEARQIVCVSGWVRLTKPVEGSSDGLLIVDSLTGEALADRIQPGKDWRQFALYRIAPQSGPMCVTFALSGIGEAHIDDVAIQVIEGSANVTRNNGGIPWGTTDERR
jgi:hypothetical protein